MRGLSRNLILYIGHTSLFDTLVYTSGHKVRSATILQLSFQEEPLLFPICLDLYFGGAEWAKTEILQDKRHVLTFRLLVF
jgi:hypothetical protein